MVINGREVRFLRSVLANCEIADASPGGDVGKFIATQLMNESYVVSQKAAAVIMTALSRGYETAQKYKEPGYKQHPLTEEEVMSLEPKEFDALFEEAMAVFRRDGKVTVEGEPAKTGKKTAKAEK